MTNRVFTKFPYRTEFPDSSERARNHQVLEDALLWARWTVDLVWRETNAYGNAGEYVHDSETAIITNRNTGYRWILRRRKPEVEFQTPEMLERSVAAQGIQLYLTVEEAEALANAIAPMKGSRDRERCVVEQALDQVALVVAGCASTSVAATKRLMFGQVRFHGGRRLKAKTLLPSSKKLRASRGHARKLGRSEIRTTSLSRRQPKFSVRRETRSIAGTGSVGFRPRSMSRSGCGAVGGPSSPSRDTGSTPG
jgi:hypothetical protein